MPVLLDSRRSWSMIESRIPERVTTEIDEIVHDQASHKDKALKDSEYLEQQKDLTTLLAQYELEIANLVRVISQHDRDYCLSVEKLQEHLRIKNERVFALEAALSERARTHTIETSSWRDRAEIAEKKAVQADQTDLKLEPELVVMEDQRNRNTQDPEKTIQAEEQQIAENFKQLQTRVVNFGEAAKGGKEQELRLCLEDARSHGRELKAVVRTLEQELAQVKCRHAMETHRLQQRTEAYELWLLDAEAAMCERDRRHLLSLAGMNHILQKSQQIASQLHDALAELCQELKGQLDLICIDPMVGQEPKACQSLSRSGNKQNFDLKVVRFSPHHQEATDEKIFQIEATVSRLDICMQTMWQAQKHHQKQTNYTTMDDSVYEKIRPRRSLQGVTQNSGVAKLIFCQVPVCCKYLNFSQPEIFKF